jgi:hypothetical protein
MIIPILHDTNGQRSVSKMASYRSEARNDAILVTGAVHNTNQLPFLYSQTRQRPTPWITGRAKPVPVHLLVGQISFIPNDISSLYYAFNVSEYSN